MSELQGSRRASRKDLRLVLAGLLLAWPAEAARVSFTMGSVLHNKAPAKINTTVNKGDMLKTGANSLAILKLDNGAQVKLNANSRVRLASATEVRLLAGGAFSKVPTKRRFRIKTKSAVMGVRGTEFFASFGGKKKDLWMCVNEGKVKLTSLKTRKAVLVKKGEGVLLPKGEKLTKPKPYAWTKKLNWNMDPASGDVVNKVSMEEAYGDALNRDYD